jgi:hypothetical protein
MIAIIIFIETMKSYSLPLSPTRQDVGQLCVTVWKDAWFVVGVLSFAVTLVWALLTQ